MDDEEPQAGGEVDNNSAGGLRAFFDGEHPAQRAERAYIASLKGDYSLLADEIDLWNPYLKDYRAAISAAVARAPALPKRRLKSLPVPPAPELFAAALVMFEARACGVGPIKCISMAMEECARPGVVTDDKLRHLWRDRAKFWPMWDAHSGAFLHEHPVIFFSRLCTLRAIFIVSHGENQNGRASRASKKAAVAVALRSRSRRDVYGQLCALAESESVDIGALHILAERQLDDDLRLNIEGRLEL